MSDQRILEEQLERLRNWAVPGGIYDGIRHDPRPDLRALLADYDSLRVEIAKLREREGQGSYGGRSRPFHE